MSHDPTQEFNESAWDTSPEAAAAAAAAGEYLDMGAAFCLSTRTYCHYTRKWNARISIIDMDFIWVL